MAERTRTWIVLGVVFAVLLGSGLWILASNGWSFTSPSFDYRPYYPEAVREWSEQFGSGARCGEGIVSRNSSFDRGTSEFHYASKWLRSMGCEVGQ